MAIAKWRQFTSEEIYNIYKETSTQKEFFMRLGYKESKDYSSTMKEFKKVYPDMIFSHSKYKAGQVIGDITLIKECGREEKTKLVIWECKCNKCNKIFTQTTKHFKTMCIDCKKIETKENQSENIQGQIFNYLIPIKKIVNANGPIRWICTCTLCGKETAPILTNNIKNGAVKSCGCLKSRGEKNTQDALDKLNIEYIREFSFPDLYGDKKQLRFDFALFKNGNVFGVIECNGEQHYKINNYFGGENAFLKLKEYDERKKEYCKKNNIPMYIIKYEDYNFINPEYIKKLIGKEFYDE